MIRRIVELFMQSNIRDRICLHSNITYYSSVELIFMWYTNSIEFIENKYYSNAIDSRRLDFTGGTLRYLILLIYSFFFFFIIFTSDLVARRPAKEVHSAGRPRDTHGKLRIFKPHHRVLKPRLYRIGSNKHVRGVNLNGRVKRVFIHIVPKYRPTRVYVK